MLTRCLIANRGEIAVRIMRACRELGMQTVAVYSDADAGALFVSLADEAVALGGAAPGESYLVTEKLIKVALTTGCDCVHPGYGFLSESAAFAQAVMDAGLTWVGPPPEAIRLMGVKTQARALMEQANVPLALGFASDSTANAPFIEAAVRIGYPVMVKAAGGGGGKGIRIAHHPEELVPSLETARREAQKAFGDARVFLEKYIEHARHIEVQVFGDTHGNIVHLYERECSAQRRHQKVIEESPSPLLNDQQRAAIGQAAVDAARAVGYVNAGTVEFIATPQGDFYFLEMNTRLQVEHPVTELVTGLDLVKLQFRVASGEPLPFTQADVTQRGHAIECRLYAEDPNNAFLPSIGTLHRVMMPQAPNIRVDSGVEAGSQVSIHYDPMIAKLIAYGENRAAALARIKQALRDTVILGVTTNIPFLLALLEHPRFEAGEVHTAFIDENLDALLSPAPPPEDALFIAAALAQLNARGTLPAGGSGADPDGDAFSPWARPDSFRLGAK